MRKRVLDIRPIEEVSEIKRLRHFIYQYEKKEVWKIKTCYIIGIIL
jgi:hypothetical protein